MELLAVYFLSTFCIFQPRDLVSHVRNVLDCSNLCLQMPAVYSWRNGFKRTFLNNLEGLDCYSSAVLQQYVIKVLEMQAQLQRRAEVFMSRVDCRDQNTWSAGHARKLILFFKNIDRSIQYFTLHSTKRRIVWSEGNAESPM